MYNDMPEDKIDYRVEIEEQEEGFVVGLYYYTNADVWGYHDGELAESETFGLDEEDFALVEARELSAKHDNSTILLHGFEVY